MQVDRTATLLAEELSVSVSASQSGDPEDKVFRFDSAKLSMVSVAQCRAAREAGASPWDLISMRDQDPGGQEVINASPPR